MDYSSILAYLRPKTHILFLSTFWLMPFISSIVGFQCIKWLTTTTLVTTPSVLGMPIAQAVTLLADQGLNVRILKEKEDNTVKPGMIINQNPRPNERIKKQQSVFLVITKPTPKPQAPDLIGQQESKAISTAQHTGFKVKTFKISSNFPTGTVLAQLPQVGQSNDTNELLLYVSGESKKYRIMPSFIHQTQVASEALLKEYGIKATIKQSAINAENPVTPESKIIKQYPLPGQIVDVAAISTISLTI